MYISKLFILIAIVCVLVEGTLVQDCSTKENEQLSCNTRVS